MTWPPIYSLYSVSSQFLIVSCSEWIAALIVGVISFIEAVPFYELQHSLQERGPS